MKGLSHLFQWSRELDYEIVEHGFRSAKIIVYAEPLSLDNVKIVAVDKSLLIVGSTDEKAYYCRVPLWFKPRKYSVSMKNGIMTIRVKGRRFLIF